MRYLHFLITLLLSACILISGCGELGKSEADYKKEAVSIKYEDVARNPDSFNKKAVFIQTGWVNDIKENNKNVEVFLTEGSNFFSLNSNQAFYVSYTVKENEERLMKGDIIRVWGDFQKVSNRQIPGALGLAQTNTVDITAKYILRPLWSSLIRNSYLNEKINNKSIFLALAINKVNENNIDIEGSFQTEAGFFYFTGTIDDAGTGKVKYLDDKKNTTNIEAIIKITKDAIEFNTPEVKFEQIFAFQSKGTITLESGNYIFKTKK